MAKKNPFTPTFGRVPLLMAGRYDIVSDMERAFEEGAGNPNLSAIFTGTRGSGKTALLLYLSRIAQSQGWITVNVSSIPGMLEDILERAYEATSHIVPAQAGGYLKGITVGSVGVEWESDKRTEGNWRTRMTRLLDGLEESDTGLLITVDEVNPDLDEMIQLASVYQHFVGEERKVGLLLAGLPGKVSALLRDESVSFLRRANKQHLGMLPDADISEGIRLTVEESGRSIDVDALDLAVDGAEGFPYLMQLIGFHSWEVDPDANAVTIEHVKRGVDVAKRNFDGRVLEATYYDLSPKDLEFLEAMLEDDGESRLSEISARLGKESNYTSTYKRRLIEQGIIGERGSSYVVFELPGFRDYLRKKLS